MTCQRDALHAVIRVHTGSNDVVTVSSAIVQVVLLKGFSLLTSHGLSHAYKDAISLLPSPNGGSHPSRHSLISFSFFDRVNCLILYSSFSAADFVGNDQ